MNSSSHPSSFLSNQQNIRQALFTNFTNEGKKSGFGDIQEYLQELEAKMKRDEEELEEFERQAAAKVA